MQPPSTSADPKTPRTCWPAYPSDPLTPGERALLAGFVQRVVAALGAEQVERIVVFGSRARGAGHSDSDLDVAVLMSSLRPASTGAIGHRLGELAAEAQIGWEELAPLRPALLDAARPRSPMERALLAAIANDGITLVTDVLAYLRAQDPNLPALLDGPMRDAMGGLATDNKTG